MVPKSNLQHKLCPYPGGRGECAGSEEGSEVSCQLVLPWELGWHGGGVCNANWGGGGVREGFLEETTPNLPLQDEKELARGGQQDPHLAVLC